MGLLFSIILLIVFFKLFFAIGSGILKIILSIVAFCILMAILPVSLIFFVPIAILILCISIFIGFIQWIL